MKVLKKNIRINSMKFDGSIHRSWTADLIEQRGSLLAFRGVFDQMVDHPFLGVIRPGTVSYEFYWLDDWFNVFRFHEPEGGFRNFYCNINQPPDFQKGVLNYIDLDIDVIVNHDYSYTVLDRDEFDSNSKLYGYSAELRSDVENHLNKLIEKIEKRRFPFDYSAV